MKSRDEANLIHDNATCVRVKTVVGIARRSQHRYQILAAEAMEGMAKSLQDHYPDRFRFHPSTWDKFPDGTDNIEVSAIILPHFPSLAALMTNKMAIICDGRCIAVH